MGKTTALVLAVVFVVVALAGGVWLYDLVLGDTEAPSATVSAPTLEVAIDPTSPAAAETDPSAAPAQPSSTPASAEPTALAGATDEPPAQGEVVVYEINQDESQVRFTIYEVLRGAPKDVIGASNQVAGQVAVNLSDLSTTQLGEIVINARSLETDDNRRNQSIRNRILFTDQYEFINFKPTQISGLSGSAAPGQSFTFQVTGDLTIRDVTKPVTFDVNVTVDSLDRLSGSAKSSLALADFNLAVPSVPFVANVGDTITLEFDFVVSPS